MHAALRRAGVPEGIYEIGGVHEPVPPAPDFLYLRRGVRGWEIGVFERGVNTVASRFESEDDACRAFLAMLTSSAGPSAP